MEPEWDLDSPDPTHLDQYENENDYPYNPYYDIRGRNDDLYYDLSDEGTTFGLRGWSTPITGEATEGHNTGWLRTGYFNDWNTHASQIYSRPMETLRGWSGDVPSYYSIESQTLDWLQNEDELDKAYAWPA